MAHLGRDQHVQPCYQQLTSEHLLPVDPRTKEAQDFLYDWLKNWCETHPQTNVVRFTSMFYNFVWIWGSDKRNQNLFTDWGQAL